MKRIKRWTSAWLIICMLLTATPVLAESGETLTESPTPAIEQSAEPMAEPSGTPTGETSTESATAAATLNAEGTPSPAPTGGENDLVAATDTPVPAGEGATVLTASASAEPTVAASHVPEMAAAPARAANVTLGTSNAMVNDGELNGTGTWGLDIENKGLISAGNYTKNVYNSATGRITGGNFTGSLENHNSVTGAYLDCEITNFGTIEGCTFGPNAKVSSNSGTIELTVNVDGQDHKVNFGDNILATLGGGTWYYVSGDIYTKVEDGDGFDLSTLTFTSTVTIALPAPSADINYFDEAVTVTLPSELDSSVDKAELILAFTLNGVKYTKEGAFAGGDSYTIDLSDLGTALGATLPYDKNYSHVDEIGVFLAADNVEGAVFTLKVAARPALDRPTGADCSAGYDSIQLLGGLTDTFDFGLAKKESSTASAPSEPEYIDEDGDGLITGLEEGTTYWVYLRRKATSTSFRSEWGYNYWNTTSTNKATHLTVSTKTPTYTWRPGFNLPSFNITNSILFNKADGGTLAINKKNYSLAITDANGNAISYISDAGVYTVKVTLEDYNNCVLDDDAFTITVEPLDLSAENVILELDLWEEQKAVYTGAPTYPQLGDAEIKIKINGNSSGYLSTDYYAVGAAEGKNNVNAGEAWLTISAKDGQSNVVGSQEVAYQILPQQATLAVAEEHCEAVWSQDFALTEEALRALFTVNDASGQPIDGSLYTIAVTKDGVAVAFPVRDIGEYVVEVALNTGNYTLAANSFAYTVVGRDVNTLTAATIPAQTYTGGAIYPAVSLWDGETQLVMGVDYAVSYQDNVNVGVGIVVITGMGDYTGTRLLFFDIVPPQAVEEERPSGGSGGSTSDSSETAESTGEAQQDRLVVDENGTAMPYTYSTVEVIDEITGTVLARKLVIVADPVRDETGAIVYDVDGQPLYEARSLLLSRELLNAIASRGYTHIRFAVKDAALEWPLASMVGDSYIVHLAPLKAEEWNEREIAAIEGMPVLSQGYRAQIVTVENGEEIDVTKGILELKALLLAEAVSLAPEGMEESLLLVPLAEQTENGLSPANWVEATQIEPARYEALLIDSGLFAMVGE